MIHIDLFAGIGGFSYAVDQVWKNAEHVFVEIDPFCQAVLKKHWSKGEFYGDIRQFIADTDRSGCRTSKSKVIKDGTQNIRKRNDTFKEHSGCDFLTGGFPCQPFSHAGRRKGTDDDRYLWSPMFDVIRLYRPRWIIAENVAGLVTWNNGLVLEQVCTDLEKENYEVQPFIIPAVSVNAPHRRDRVWIVAYNTKQRLSISFSRGKYEESRKGKVKSRSWEQNWVEVAQRFCRMDDGIPARLGGLGREDYKFYPWWRKEALKAYGNAIVPQVAIEIMRAIKYADV
jgi:DNA (cytosine-5)-methyltransferase 1